MLSAGRSLTEPPGLNHSALAENSTLGNSRPIRSSRRSGVLPMRSRTERPIAPETEPPEVARCFVAIVVMRDRHYREV